MRDLCLSLTIAAVLLVEVLADPFQRPTGAGADGLHRHVHAPRHLTGRQALVEPQQQRRAVRLLEDGHGQDDELVLLRIGHHPVHGRGAKAARSWQRGAWPMFSVPSGRSPGAC